MTGLFDPDIIITTFVGASIATILIHLTEYAWRKRSKKKQEGSSK